MQVIKTVGEYRVIYDDKLIRTKDGYDLEYGFYVQKLITIGISFYITIKAFTSNGEDIDELHYLKREAVDLFNKIVYPDKYFIADAVLSIGVDTGMQHIADAVGVRTLSIFGPTNPKTHGAYSEKAQFIECLEDTADKYCFETDAYYTIPVKECMRQITSDKVYDKVRNILHLRERE